MIILNNLKIRTKLVILTVFLAGCTFTVGLVGYTYAKNARTALDNIYNQNLRAVILLNDAMNQARENSADGMKLMLVSDSTEQELIGGDIDRRINTIKSDLAEYENTNFDAFESKQFNLLQAKVQEWNSEFEKIREFSGNGSAVEAAVLFRTTGEAAFEEFQRSVQELVNYNIEEAEVIYQQNTTNDQEAFRFLALLTAGAILVSISGGILITRSITKPIERAIAFINETSDPDLLFDSSDESQLRYKGEIGMLISSIFKMKKSVSEQIMDIVSGDVTVNSQELPVTEDAQAIIIDPDMYTLNSIAEENQRQAEKLTVTDLETDAVNKDHSDSSEAANIDGLSLEEATVEPFHIFGKGRKKAVLAPKIITEKPGSAPELTEKPESAPEFTERPWSAPDSIEKPESATDFTEQPMSAPELTEKPMSEPVSEETADVYSNLNELMLKVDSLKDLVYEITSQSNIFTMNTVTGVTKAGADNTDSAAVTEGTEATSVSVELIAATSARLARLAEEIKDGAVNIKY